MKLFKYFFLNRGIKNPYKLSVIVISFILSGTCYAAPYPLGTLTCNDMGEFASKAMKWRLTGKTPKEVLKELDGFDFNDPVERKNFISILQLVYGGYGENWTIKTAKQAIITDCLTGR